MTRSQSTVHPPSTRIYDLICAYLAGEFSEGFLRDMLRDQMGMSGDEVRAMWFDAVERGIAMSTAWHETRGKILSDAKLQAMLGTAGL